MITFIAIFGHLVLNFLLGFSILSFAPKIEKNWGEKLTVSILLGIFTETLLIFLLLWTGLSLVVSVFVFCGMVFIVTLVTAFCGKFSFKIPKFVYPKWFEFLLLAAIFEKISFAVWQLTRTHTYFDDALGHWSGRGYAIFSGVNFSFDPSSTVFLGSTGSDHYPLLVPIWRAVTAFFAGEWNEIISRVDGVVFLILIAAIVWLTVLRFSEKRWLATAATFSVISLPMFAWHAAAGYADIALAVFAVAALAAVLRNEFVIAGFLTAGAIWTKNDAILLYAPAIFAAVGMTQFSWREVFNFHIFDRDKWVKIGKFMLGVVTILPWFIFKFIFGLGTAAGSGRLGWHAEAPRIFWKVIVTGPTHGIFWLGIFAAFIWCFFDLAADRLGRTLVISFLVTFFAIIFVFFGTYAFAWMNDQTTIHRTMMQFAPIATIVVFYGLFLKMKK